jgi:D-inositol-3-phosphate glycosyltransferase
MTKPIILHLVDDTTAGGVMRVLETLLNDDRLRAQADHRLCVVTRGHIALGRLHADVIVSHMTMSWRGFPALVALRARHSGVPMIHVEHSYTERFAALNVDNPRRFTTMLRASYAMFEHVVAVSAAQGAWLLRRGLVSENALKVIPSTVDLNAFFSLSAPSKPVKIFGLIGRLETQKGHDTAIRAFRQRPDLDAELWVFGTGALEQSLRDLAGDDKRIIFKGHAPAAQDAMAQVDAVLMPSRWEAFGLVALESRAAGRPIIVSAVDGLIDQIGTGVTSVNGAGVGDWALAIERMCQSENTPRNTTEIRLSAAEHSKTSMRLWQSLLHSLVGEMAEAA